MEYAEDDDFANDADDGGQDESLKCFDEILALRGEICIRENVTSQFLTNAMIGGLTRSAPRSARELVEALPVPSRLLVEKYAGRIMELLAKYRLPA